MTGGSLALAVEQVYRAGRARLLAALVRAVGDFEPAEDALQEACAVARREMPGESAREGENASDRSSLGDRGRPHSTGSGKKADHSRADEPPAASRIKSESRSMETSVPPALPNSCW